jgi:hypothetical protein
MILGGLLDRTHCNTVRTVALRYKPASSICVLIAALVV